MPPPNLARDAPVSYILKPIQINFLPALWMEFNFSRFNVFDREFRELIHFQKPLLRAHRLNYSSATGTDGNVVRVVFNFFYQFEFFEFRDNFLPRFFYFESCKFFPRFVCHPRVFVYDLQEWQFMVDGNRFVGRVMVRSYFNRSSSEFHFNFMILNDLDFSILNREYGS